MISFSGIIDDLEGDEPAVAAGAANAVEGVGSQIVTSVAQSISPSAGVVVPVTVKQQEWILVTVVAVVFLLLWLWASE